MSSQRPMQNYRGSSRVGMRSAPYRDHVPPRRGMGRNTRLRPPPSERLFGSLPSKRLMLDVLGAPQGAASSTPHASGWQPLVTRQAQAEGITCLNNRHLIQLGLKLQQSMRLDSQPINNTLNALHSAALEAALQKTTLKVDAEEEEIAGVSLSALNSALLDSTLTVARDLSSLIELIDRRDALTDANTGLLESIRDLSAELDAALRTRAELLECESTAGQLLQQESTAQINARIDSEQAKLASAQEELKSRKERRIERMEMVVGVNDRLKEILAALTPHS